MKKKISYIFPIYNEEGNIDRLFELMSAEIKKISDQYDFEVICINDGSKDSSLEKLIDIQKRDKRFKIINFSKNFGHQMAITAGMDYAKGDAIIIMDADLQDPPSVSLELIKKWEEGFEVVYAQRKSRKDSRFKRFTAFLFYRLLDKLADIRIPKDTGDFRLMDKKVVDTLRQFREKNRFMRGLVAYVGFKQTGVLFDRDERFSGKTHYPLKKMLKLAFDGITGFSTVPLKIMTQIGLFVSLVSLFGIFFALFVRIFIPEATIPGTTFAIIAILFIGGIQMLMMGTLGTYIGRIYSEVQNRPLYIVSSIYAED